MIIVCLFGLWVVLKISNSIIDGVQKYKYRHGIDLNPIQYYQYYTSSYDRKHITELRRMNYKAYLCTEHWKILREAILFRDNYHCYDCELSDKVVKLQVHHLTYVNRGHEQLGDLISVCGSCHNLRHGILPE